MRELFGVLPDGTPVHRYVIRSAELELHLLDLGATTHQLHVSDREGKWRNVLLGHGDAAAQYASPAYLGSTVGRYANRLAGARFALDGNTYQLAANEGPHTLHGGPEGFHRRIWAVAEHTSSTVTFVLDSPDGDQGFPGNLRCYATYAADADTVTITYRATTDKPTVVSVTNHAYFNLNGEGTGSVDDHLLTVHASSFTPVGPDLIPFGQTQAVVETVMDWREPAQIGKRLAVQDEQLSQANGLDHNFVIEGAALRPAASLYSPDSGLQLAVSSDQPGLQVYTGNHLDATIVGPSGQAYGPRAGIALETQRYPDAPNQPAFPPAILHPGQSYENVTRWRLSPVGLRPGGALSGAVAAPHSGARPSR